MIGHSLLRESDAVAEAGLRLARGLNSRPLVLHATSPARERLRQLETGAGAAGDDERDRLLAELGRRVSEPARRIGCQPACQVTAGPPHEALNRVASEVDAELLFVGAHERRGFPFGIIGSTVDRLLRTAVRPVLILRSELHVPPRQVVIAVDLSSFAFAALRCAEGIQRPLVLAAHQEVLTVLDPNEQRRPLPSEQLDGFVFRELRRLLALYSEADPGAVELVVRRGDARQEILDELERRQADLVVVAAHGSGGSSRFRQVGKVADEIARRSPCSVLFVPLAAGSIAAQNLRSAHRHHRLQTAHDRRSG